MFRCAASLRRTRRLNESPHPKVGKCSGVVRLVLSPGSLNESPHPKVGKFHTVESHSSPGRLPQ